MSNSVRKELEARMMNDDTIYNNGCSSCFGTIVITLSILISLIVLL